MGNLAFFISALNALFRENRSALAEFIFILDYNRKEMEERNRPWDDVEGVLRAFIEDHTHPESEGLKKNFQEVTNHLMTIIRTIA